MNESTEEPNPSSLTRTYWCFISYRHSDNKEEGREWATWLHQQLETYPVPEDLAGKINDRGEQIPEQIFPVFRDEEELSGGHLKEGIEEALENAKSFVVICSPRTLESPYVAEEIRIYKMLRNREIAEGKAIVRAEPLVAIIEGDPTTPVTDSEASFPKELIRGVDTEGNLTPESAPEILWIDFRLPDETQGWTSTGAYRKALGKRASKSKEAIEAYGRVLELGKLRIIGGILGVPLGELEKRDQAYKLKREQKRARRLRRTLALVGLFALAAILAAVVAIGQTKLADRQTEIALKEKREAQTQAGKGWLLRSAAADKEDEHVASMYYAARAIGFEGFGRPAPEETIPEGDKSPLRRNFARLLGLKNSPITNSTEEFPDFLSENTKLRRQALHRVARSKATPFVWSSPSISHHSSGINCVRFSPESSILASSSFHELKIWDLNSGAEKMRLGHKPGGNPFCFSPDGKYIASGWYRYNEPEAIRIWDMHTGLEVQNWNSGLRFISFITFSQDGKHIASGGVTNYDALNYAIDTGFEDIEFQEQIVIRDVSSGKTTHTLPVENQLVFNGSFSIDGRFLAGSTGKEVLIWNIKKQQLAATLKGKYEANLEGTVGVLFSPDGKFLASCGGDAKQGRGEVVLWKVGSWEKVASFEEPDNVVSHLSFSPNGKLLASAGSTTKGGLRIRDVKSGKTLAFFPNEGRSGIQSIDFSPDGKTLVGGLANNTITFWDVESGEQSKDELAGHTDSVTMIAVSPDGKYLASGGSEYGAVKEIKIWKVAAGEIQSTLRSNESEISCFTFCGTTNVLASGSEDGSIHFWDIQKGTKTTGITGLTDQITAIAVDGEGHLLATASRGESSDNQQLKLWDIETGSELRTLVVSRHDIRTIAFSPDGALIAGSGYQKAESNQDGTTLWDVNTGEQVRKIPGHSSALVFSPDGRILAGGDHSGIRLYLLDEGKFMEDKGSLDAGSVSSVAFSPKGDVLVTGGTLKGAGVIQAWQVPSESDGDNASLELLTTFHGHSAEVNDVAFSPGGNTIFSASKDNTLKMWTLQNREEIDSFSFGSLRQLAMSPDKLHLALIQKQTENSETIQILDITTGETLATLSPDWPVRCLAWNRDGTILAVGGGLSDYPGQFALWNWQTGEIDKHTTAHNDSLTGIAWSRNGEILASNAYLSSIILTNLNNGEQKTLSSSDGNVESMAFHPRDHLLVSGGGGSDLPGQINLWDLKEGRIRAKLKGHTTRVNAVRFNRDGTLIASGSEDGSIRIWSTSSGKQLKHLEGHSDSVRSMDFHAVDSLLVSASDDGTLKLWDIESGMEIASLRGHSRGVSMVAFGADGKSLVSGSVDDTTVKKWAIPPKNSFSQPELFTYLTEGWCEFDEDSGELLWRTPTPSLYQRFRPTPFRNLSPNSTLGLLRNTELSEQKKSWKLYLRALEAESWDYAAKLSSSLSAKQKARPHATVNLAIRKLIDRAAKACRRELPGLAAMRTRSALSILAGQSKKQHDSFHESVENSILRDFLSPADAAPMLKVIQTGLSWRPENERIISRVVEAFQQKLQQDIQANSSGGSYSNNAFEDATKLQDLATSWGNDSVDRYYRDLNREELRDRLYSILNWERQNPPVASRLALELSSFLAKTHPDWPESHLYRAKALLFAKRPEEALAVAEQALKIPMEKTIKGRLKKISDDAEAMIDQ